jgi:hypothetical protein
MRCFRWQNICDCAAFYTGCALVALEEVKEVFILEVSE